MSTPASRPRMFSYLYSPQFRAVPVPLHTVMVRAVSVHRNSVILFRMDTAVYEPGMRILREGRRKAPSPLSGAPTMVRHEEPRAAGSAGMDTDGHPVGGHTWIRGGMRFSVGLDLHGGDTLASESGRSVRERRDIIDCPSFKRARATSLRRRYGTCQ